MSKHHTPGPWVARRNSAFWEFAQQGKWVTIGDVCSTNPSNPDDGLQEANARLIAAAPDMLDALEMALASGLIRASDPVNDPGTLCPVHDAISAAIAKARGQQ